MKVNNPSAKNVAQSSAQIQAKELEKGLAQQKPNQAKGSEQTAVSSRVQVSPEAQAFQKAKAIASKDTIDEAKVARLQKMIDDGKYKVDAKAVADRLVDEQLATGE